MADLPERFWSKTELIPFSSCWYWTGSLTRGYGYATVNKKVGYAHRHSWEFNFGAIPKGMCVCHKCDNPICIRPDHLFLGTHADNVRDKIAKGRARTGKRIGTQHKHAKLNDEKVLLAYQLKKSGLTLREIAQQVGASKSAVGNIFTKTTWRHVNGI